MKNDQATAVYTKNVVMVPVTPAGSKRNIVLIVGDHTDVMMSIVHDVTMPRLARNENVMSGFFVIWAIAFELVPDEMALYA